MSSFPQQPGSAALGVAHLIVEHLIEAADLGSRAPLVHEAQQLLPLSVEGGPQHRPVRRRRGRRGQRLRPREVEGRPPAGGEPRRHALEDVGPAGPGGQVGEAEIGAEDRRERSRNGKGRHVAPDEADSRGDLRRRRLPARLGLGQHLGRKIEADHRQAAFGQGEADAARAGAQLQHAAALRHEGRIEVDIPGEVAIERRCQVVEGRRKIARRIVRFDLGHVRSLAVEERPPGRERQAPALRPLKARPTFARETAPFRFELGAPALKSLAARLSRAAALVLLPLALAGCGINTIPTKDERAKAAWAEVQNQYQRRSDLIPNLVATVQGYANQEQEVLTAVTQARASATQVQVDASTITDPEQFQRFAQAQDQLTGVLGRLMMIQERYPDLKSNQNFLALQSQLEGTENRIAIARRDYNEAVRDYNTEIRTFPGAIWANTVHGWAEPMQTFQASPAAQTAPSVSFDQPAAPAAQPAPAPAVQPAPESAPAQ